MVVSPLSCAFAFAWILTIKPRARAGADFDMEKV